MLRWLFCIPVVSRLALNDLLIKAGPPLSGLIMLWGSEVSYRAAGGQSSCSMLIVLECATNEQIRPLAAYHPCRYEWLFSFSFLALLQPRPSGFRSQGDGAIFRAVRIVQPADLEPEFIKPD